MSRCDSLIPWVSFGKLVMFKGKLNKVKLLSVCFFFSPKLFLFTKPIATVYSADIEKLKEGVLAVTHHQEVSVAFEWLHFGVS